MTHLHVRSLVRCASAVCVVFAVQHIVRKRFHILEIHRIVLGCGLLIVKQDPLMSETGVLKKDRSALIGSDISVFLLKTDVVPDDISRLIQIVCLVVLFLDVQRRYVIAVYDHHCRFIGILDLFYEFSDEGIHLMTLIEIVLVFPLRFLIVTGDRCIRILKDPFCRIRSVSFYGDDMHEVSLFRRLHDLHYFSCEDSILAPVRRRK